MLEYLHRSSQRARRSSTSSDNSAYSSIHEDDQHTAAAAAMSPSSFDNTSRRQSSACASERSCEGLSAAGTRDLWRCMLELQERYGCYHCTRIDLALDAGDEGVQYMPNRFIIDTLNDSIIDFLPEEGWEMLTRCLHPDDRSPSPSPSEK